jgi:hypothetical protein
VNLKWGAISCLAAFVLAFVTSLFVGHTSFTVALLRAAGFGGLFFALGIGAWMLINTFIPDLLFGDPDKDTTEDIFSTDSSGSHVNITLGDASDAALPGKGANAYNADDVEDIDDLVSGKIFQSNQRIDQEGASDYTMEDGDLGSATEGFAAADSSPSDAPDAASFGDGNFSPIDFSSFGSSESNEADAQSVPDFFSFTSYGNDTEDSYESPVPERKKAANKPSEYEGDFNPKEIAAGIRTVLESDKKG